MPHQPRTEDQPYPLQIGSGTAMHVHRWQPRTTPRAQLLIVHGMAEHGARYARLAGLLNERGVEVHAPDLPGHGLTAAAGQLGSFGPAGWRGVLDAIHTARSQIAARWPTSPLFLFGHSMGSFLSQHYLVEHGEGLAGAVLSATTGSMGPLRGIGIALLKLESLFRGRQAPAAVADLMGFKTFNKAFAPNRTDFDWLSRDTAEVDRYIADPLCGFRCTAQLWLDLLAAGGVLLDEARLARIPRSLPIRLIAGSLDPVSQGARGPQLLAQAYRQAGIREVSVRVWPEARHELLNETCRDEVMSDLALWLDLQLR